MPQILEAVDRLRGRFARLRGKRSLLQLEEAVGIHRNTLAVFVRGDMVQEKTLHAIEAWCHREEAQTHE